MNASDTITTARANDFGFLTADDLAVIAADTRFRTTPVLVRCGMCRFIVAADQAKHLIDIITTEGRDHVRDVSLPAQ